MKKIQTIWQMLRMNMNSFLIFEFAFKILSLLIFTPLFLNIFNFIMNITGYKYITYENIGSFLSNPITIILLIVLILIMMVYTMFDITTIIVILDHSYHKKKIKVIDALKYSLKRCSHLFSLKNISLAFLILFLIPFLNLGITSGFISTISIPEFILDFINTNHKLTFLFILLMIILTIIFLNWLYSLHYQVLENISFKEARQKSRKLGRKKHLQDLLSIIIIQFVYVMFYIIYIILGILIIIILNQLFNKILLINSFMTTVIWFFIAISIVIFTLLSTPISFAIISVLFYYRKDQRKEKSKPLKIKITNTKKKDLFLKKVVIVFILCAILGGTFFTYGLYKGKYNLNIAFTRTLEVTAHRGASITHPENTMAAFKEAKNLGTDWIELDVQQTKDKKIIVIHDHNLERTAKVNKNIWELTYDEIKELDVGSYLKEDFKEERIPLLKDVLTFAKENNLKLNIELKPTGHETDFEKNVIDLINEYDFKNDCVLTSQVYEVLEKIKDYDNDIKTVYVMSLAYGDITSLTKADHFSIESTSITSSLVKKVHSEGKELYAWTVNTEENINKMINLKVDNIITDDITLAKDTIYRSKTSNLINEYIKLVENIFK